MPKPSRAMGNLKSDTRPFLYFFLNSDRRQESQEFQTKNSRAIPHDPTPKIEKAKGNLKCWMVSRLNRGFDSHSHVYLHVLYVSLDRCNRALDMNVNFGASHSLSWPHAAINSGS